MRKSSRPRSAVRARSAQYGAPKMSAGPGRRIAPRRRVEPGAVERDGEVERERRGPGPRAYRRRQAQTSGGTLGRQALPLTTLRRAGAVAEHVDLVAAEHVADDLVVRRGVDAVAGVDEHDAAGERHLADWARGR